MAIPATIVRRVTTLMAAFTNATVEQVGMSSHEVMGFSDGGKHL
jgi:hypothetical protein